MKTTISFIIILLCINLTAQNNSLYIPLENRAAYEKGTRSYDGKPGKNYWVNHSSYKIKAEIDPATKILTGSEEVTYHNNSPDSLETIIIRLYQDIYKAGNERDVSIAPESITDGMVIEKIEVNGNELDLESEEPKFVRRNTLLYLRLDSVLVPDASIELSFDWHFEIPSGTKIRMGQYDSTSFFIGYWYPQIAVYDDIEGWDRYEYVGHEYYNDINDFDVEITVPSDYNLWATGTFQNPDEIYSDKILESYKKAQSSDTVINIISESDLKEENIFNDNNKNVFHFKAENVPDFAFGLSNKYLWDGTSIEVNEENKRIIISSAYPKDAEDFYIAAEVTRMVIDYLSNKLPGVPYPYPAMTIFNGLQGGGMEFPMMVNNTSVSMEFLIYGLIAHEVAHTYFPFYTGINEHKYAWMDEGWASMLPIEFVRSVVDDYDPLMNFVSGYEWIAGTGDEVPAIVNSKIAHIRSAAFSTMAYNKSAVAYYYLKDFLGEDLFKKCLIEFINRWKGKHPTPYDFFFTFNEIAGEDLSWYWKPWFFDFGYPELELSGYEIKDDVIVVNTKRNGNIPVPLKLKIIFTDGKESKYYNDASLWKNGQEIIEVEMENKGEINKIILGDKTIPDVDRNNNEIVVNELTFSISYTPEELKDFVGTYHVMENLDMKIYIENGKLMAKGTNQSAIELKPIGVNLFEHKKAGLTLEFIPNADEEINRVMVIQGGFKIPADKIE